MAAEGLSGVDVIVKIGAGPTAILGQRGAKTTYDTDMIDMSVKTDFPYKRNRPGWEGPVTIDCDGLLMAGGSGGIATLVNTIKARTLVAIEVTIGSSGEEFTGNAWMTNVEMDAPQDKEGTISCKLQVEGELIATEGA